MQITDMYAFHKAKLLNICSQKISHIIVHKGMDLFDYIVEMW